jgi:UDP-hydrolysing UDP-N-acetyl-D-glucosamine 2-epimerase
VRAVGKAIEDYRPDVLLLLGDRFESLGAAYAATHAGVPIAHIHGGEATHGAFDDQLRHAISKLACLHFVAAEPYAERLRRMGERQIHVVGAPGLDSLTDLPVRKVERYFVCTYHPCTNVQEDGAGAILEALERFQGYRAIWTGVNADPGSEAVRVALRGQDVRRLTGREYHLLCRHAACVVGNSSSGLIEAPFLGVPSVNVGRRQEGRLAGPSVFHALPHAGAIAGAIDDSLLYDGPFDSPYGGSGASQRIADILLTADLERVKAWSW